LAINTNPENTKGLASGQVMTKLRTGEYNNLPLSKPKNFGAESGSMKVTGQIDAMEVSAITPYKHLVVTRVLATTTTIPFHAMYCRGSMVLL